MRDGHEKMVVAYGCPRYADGMKTNTTTKSLRRSLPVFSQLVQLIPPGLADRLGAGAKIKARVFTYAHQVYSLLLGQLSGAFSLNEICDAEQVHRNKLVRIRGILPAKRNTFSNANRTRDPAVAERLFWELYRRLSDSFPGFFLRPHKGRLARFRLRRIFAVDATVLQLTLKSIDWAKHRKRKAAAKLHMRCDVASRLPSFAVFTPAKVPNCRRMAEVCRDLHAGDVAIFDRGYTDFRGLFRLEAKGVFFVVREKRGMRYGVDGRRRKLPANILSDEGVVLMGKESAKKYPGKLRRIRAKVEVDGKTCKMTFLTNNFEWAAGTVAELYRARWEVELLFKELKQTLQLKDFYGENEKAVMWQVWTALLAHLLLRYLAWAGRWHGSFTRFAGVVKAALWERTDLMGLLAAYGTAPPPLEKGRREETPVLKGFEKAWLAAMG